MNTNDFNELYMCNFEPDTRTVELETRLHQYYKDSDKLNDKEARQLWRDLKEWVRCSGYTNDEFNRSKRVVSGWHI